MRGAPMWITPHPNQRPYTHEDYHRDFGPGFPDFYTTPPDPSLCKNLNLWGATPCWHPHCDCQPSAPRDRSKVMGRFEKLWMFIGWRLPKPLVYWCAIRLGAHATQGEYSKDSPTDLLFMDALKRWEKQ